MSYPENDFQIRESQEADIDAIVQMTLTAWEPVYRGYQKQMGDDIFAVFHPDWREAKASSVRSAIVSGRSECFVTVRGREVAAFITFQMLGKHKIGVITDNAVHPRFQGHGIGSRQYRYVLSYMKAKGMSGVKVTTGTDEAHAPARKAYEKAGFTVSLPSTTYYMKFDA